MARIHSFPPVLGKEPRVLILGTIPGPEALRQQKYYAFKNNQFWRLISLTLGRPDPVGYEGRLGMLRGAGIALWDVLESCERVGASDGRIRDPRPNDIPGLVARHPIRRIFTNGKAAEGYLRGFFPDIELEPRALPSSSPANAAMSLLEKARRWKEVRDSLRR